MSTKDSNYPNPLEGLYKALLEEKPNQQGVIPSWSGAGLSALGKILGPQHEPDTRPLTTLSTLLGKSPFTPVLEPTILSGLSSLTGTTQRTSTNFPPLPTLPWMPATPTRPTPSAPGVAYCDRLVRIMLHKRVVVSPGRVVPKIEDLAVGTGRSIRAAFVYTDLDGFSKMVATKPTEDSFTLMQTFVEIVSRITTHYGGSVVDCAGDRILSVFEDPGKIVSLAPIYNAVTAALWTQTIIQRVIEPNFRIRGVLGEVGAAIGIDHGPATVACVGYRNNKRLIFLGEAANNAARLQSAGTAGEVVMSAHVYLHRPPYTKGPTWSPIVERNLVRFRQRFADVLENPPKAS